MSLLATAIKATFTGFPLALKLEKSSLQAVLNRIAAKEAKNSIPLKWLSPFRLMLPLIFMELPDC